MKTAIRAQMLCLSALALGCYPTSAQFVFLSDNRSAGVSGSTNSIPVYGQTNYPSMPFARFSNSVSGGFSGTGLYNLGGTASQVSILTSNAIYVTNGISLSYDFEAAPNPGITEAEGTCEITFSIARPTLVTLTGAEFLGGVIGVFSDPQYATLSSTNEVFSTARPSQNVQNWTFSFSTVLPPGTYELNADLGFYFLAAPGSMDDGSERTGFALIAVPSPEITGANANGNALELSVSAAPGSTNRVLAATNLALPMSQWQPISTNIAGTNGVFHFTNNIVPGQNLEFYRISMP